MVKLGTRPFIPPPFLTRIYRQRGLFTHVTSDAQRSALEAICWRIDFPITGYLKTTAFDRAGLAYEYALYPSEAWYLALKKWVRSPENRKALKLDNAAGRSIAFHAYLAAHNADSLSLARQLESDMGLGAAMGVDGRLPAIIRLLAAQGLRGDANNPVEFYAEFAKALNSEIPGLLDWLAAEVQPDPELLVRNISWLDEGLQL